MNSLDNLVNRLINSINKENKDSDSDEHEGPDENNTFEFNVNICDVCKKLCIKSKMTDYPVSTAIMHGHFVCLLKCIDKYGVDFADNDGDTPLLHSAYHGQVEMFKYLIEKGANIDHTNNIGNKALSECCRNGSYNMLKYILSLKHFDINHTNVYGNTPLATCVHYDRSKYIPSLLAGGADPSIRNSDGNNTFAISIHNYKSSLTFDSAESMAALYQHLVDKYVS
jgi:ankyrin repeat protein